MDIITFEISIPAPEGFIGNTCSNINCRKYFKVSISDIKDKMFCPYCGTLASKMDLRTIEQSNFIQENAKEKAKEIFNKKTDKMLGCQTSDIFPSVSFKYIPHLNQLISEYKD